MAVSGARLVILGEISAEFCAHIRARLAEFCYGATTVSEDSSFYSFEKTVAEFLRRYDLKPRKTRLGMAGELVVHVLMPLLQSDLTSAAVYFNKEERSIKKGFDLTFVNSTDLAIWYGEVKTGEVAEPDSADKKAAALVNTAATSVDTMLADRDQLSRWDAALVDTRLTLEAGMADTARVLLRSDSEAVRQGGTLQKRVVLAGTVVHELGHCVVTSVGVEAIVAAIASSDRFTEAKILVIQQDSLEAVIAYLREVADA